jgi:hypothetical protein
LGPLGCLPPFTVSQQKHLLEALSGQGGSPSRGGSPFQGEAPSASGPTRGLAPFGGGGPVGRGGLALGGSRLQLLVLAQVVLLVVAFLLGRASVQQAEARESGGPDNAGAGAGSQLSPYQGAQGMASVEQGQGVPRTAAAGAPAAGGTLPVRAEPTPVSAAEQALRDPRNIYTLKVADYVYNESSVRLAQDAARYLVESAGLPACLVQKGTRVYLLVGAAPRQVDLDDLGRTVRQLKGPPPISKPTEFHDAYVEKIDKVFQRK